MKYFQQISVNFIREYQTAVRLGLCVMCHPLQGARPVFWYSHTGLGKWLNLYNIIEYIQYLLAILSTKYKHQLKTPLSTQHCCYRTALKNTPVPHPHVYEELCAHEIDFGPKLFLKPGISIIFFCFTPCLIICSILFISVRLTLSADLRNS